PLPPTPPSEPAAAAAAAPLPDGAGPAPGGVTGPPPQPTAAAAPSIATPIIINRGSRATPSYRPGPAPAARQTVSARRHDHPEQLLDRGRFHQVMREARRRRALAIVRLAVAGQRHQPHRRQRGPRAQPVR